MSVWKQKASKSEDAEYEIPPAGNHAAVCIALIDLGTHTDEYPGKEPRDVRKILIAWELTDEQKKDGKNFVVGRDYTLSMHEKAALRILVKGWRGKDLGDGEEFDILKLLKQKCQVNLTHKQNAAKTSTYARVESVSAPIKGLKVPDATLDAIAWEIEGGSEFPLAEWIPRVYGQPALDYVKESPEWKARSGEVAGKGEGELVGTATNAADETPF